MSSVSPSINLTGMWVGRHTRRRIDGVNNHPSTGSRGSTLRTSKYGKDAKNASIIVVHFAHCRVKVHKENEYVTPRNENASLASSTIAYRYQ
jgi:hypothetical protein